MHQDLSPARCGQSADTDVLRVGMFSMVLQNWGRSCIAAVVEGGIASLDYATYDRHGTSIPSVIPRTQRNRSPLHWKFFSVIHINSTRQLTEADWARWHK